MNQTRQILLQEEEVQRTISRMAHEIVEKNGGIDDLALLGIRSRGAHLAHRIARKIETISGMSPPMGVIDVTPYRDDIEREKPTGDSMPLNVPILVEDKTVVLIDDVIYTGRTVRAALDLLGHLGRPKRILLAILVDRGDRELPIKADIVGKNVQVASTERVNVMLEESDGVDQVTITMDRQKRGLV